MTKKPITKKEVLAREERLKLLLKGAIRGAEENNAIDVMVYTASISHEVAELRKGLHPRSK